MPLSSRYATLYVPATGFAMTIPHKLGLNQALSAQNPLWIHAHWFSIFLLHPLPQWGAIQTHSTGSRWKSGVRSGLGNAGLLEGCPARRTWVEDRGRPCWASQTPSAVDARTTSNAKQIYIDDNTGDEVLAICRINIWCTLTLVWYQMAGIGFIVLYIICDYCISQDMYRYENSWCKHFCPLPRSTISPDRNQTTILLLQYHHAWTYANLDHSTVSWSQSRAWCHVEAPPHRWRTDWPETLDSASSRSTLWRVWRWPPSPLAWDAHAGPAWEPRGNCTCGGRQRESQGERKGSWGDKNKDRKKDLFET